MAHVWADRVLETSTTTGTGAFTLAAAISGFQRFSAVCSTSDTVYYAIYAVDANGNPSGDWEAGLGTYSAANTLTRTTPQGSSNAGAAVNFAAGTKHVLLTATADYLESLTPYTDEMARDAIGAALTAGTGITVTPNDGADTITIATTITQYTTALARVAATEWVPNVTATGNVYIAAREAMTIGQGNAAIGTGTIVFEKSTNAAPGTFSSTTLPATLESGAWLKVAFTSVTGFCATHLVRTT